MRETLKLVENEIRLLEKRLRKSDRTVQQAAKLLYDAAWELSNMANASGLEEMKQNPHLKGLQKLADKIHAFREQL